MRKFITCTVICVFVLTGCDLSFQSNVEPAPTTIPITNILLLSDQNTVPTPTPFQPIFPTATSGSTPTLAPTLTPSLEPSPTPASLIHIGLPRPNGQVNILILGSDYRPNQGYRTDILMVLSLNPEKGTASLTSFPRDLYVDIPGVGMSRINAAQPYGGFDLTAATFKNNLDVPIDYYVMTTFTGFKAIIDTLGEINVYAASDLYDTCDLPQAVEKHCFIAAGSNLMDGATALWYVRSRQTSNDFDRTRRAQEVLSAIFQKTMSLDALNRGAELFGLFINSVETNLSLEKVLQLLPFAGQIVTNPSMVKRYVIGSGNVTNYTVPETGSMVLIPNPQSVSEIIRQAFYQ